MLRQTAIASSTLSASQQLFPSSQLSRSLSVRTKPESVRKGDKTPTAQWLESVKESREAVPSNIIKVEYSKSSGAGGQNVNK